MNDILSNGELYLTQKYIKKYGMKYVFWVNNLLSNDYSYKNCSILLSKLISGRSLLNIWPKLIFVDNNDYDDNQNVYNIEFNNGYLGTIPYNCFFPYISKKTSKITKFKNLFRKNKKYNILKDRKLLSLKIDDNIWIVFKHILMAKTFNIDLLTKNMLKINPLQELILWQLFDILGILKAHNFNNEYNEIKYLKSKLNPVIFNKYVNVFYSKFKDSTIYDIQELSKLKYEIKLNDKEIYKSNSCQSINESRKCIYNLEKKQEDIIDTVHKYLIDLFKNIDIFELNLINYNYMYLHNINYCISIFKDLNLNTEFKNKIFENLNHIYNILINFDNVQKKLYKVKFLLKEHQKALLLIDSYYEEYDRFVNINEENNNDKNVNKDNKDKTIKGNKSNKYKIGNIKNIRNISLVKKINRVNENKQIIQKYCMENLDDCILDKDIISNEESSSDDSLLLNNRSKIKVTKI